MGKIGNTTVLDKDDWGPGGKYEQEEDVRAMARCAMIKKNPERLARAMKRAKMMKDEHKQRAEESSHIVKMAEHGKK